MKAEPSPEVGIWLRRVLDQLGVSSHALANAAGIAPGTLTLHADRGASMRSKPVAALLVDLDITKSHSRPHVSDDNPYSESQFKTLKYRPDFPERFGGVEDGRAFCRGFFAWYNHDHHHSGLGLMTPDQVHYGQADDIHAARQRTLDIAFAAHPERFVRKAPVPAAPPSTVWINPPKSPALPPTPPGSEEVQA